MWLYVGLVQTDDSEEIIASIFTENNKQASNNINIWLED
jgi:hypothetical protein